jgi:phenol 2-monooxygenase
MNVSMQDAFNLGWKLAAVLEGRSEASLLRSYSQERQAVAKELIDFDRFWSSFIAQPIVDPDNPTQGGVTSEQMQSQFARQGQYTAGVATRYLPSALTGHADYQAVATGFPVGARFHSAPVTRVSDARRMHLGHAFRADGRWRIFAFGDRDDSDLRAFTTWLKAAPESPHGASIDSVIDVHAVFQRDHHDPAFADIPGILRPHSGPLGLQDWEKVWAVDPGEDIYETRGISRDGAIVVVRPDQYVAHVLPLSARAELSDFFAGVLVERAAIALAG